MAGHMGRFELAVMGAVIRLREQAYGRRIHDHLEERLDRTIPLGQVYVALGRLKERGFLTSEAGDPTPVRGGRSKTFYSLTGLGRKAWDAEREHLSSVTRLSPQPKGA